MARPAHPIGTHGVINVRAVIDGVPRSLADVPEGVTPTRYRASTRYRDADGKTRPVTRDAATPTKAKAALRQACLQRGRSHATYLAGNVRFAEMSERYLAKVKAKRAATTYDVYESYLRTIVVPALGNLLLHEVDVACCQDFMDALERRKMPANTRRTVRTVLRGVLQLAVREKVFVHNPARELEVIEGDTEPPVAFTAVELRDFLAKLAEDEVAQRTNLGDIVRTLFATGCRIGEVLALRWCDINLTDEPVWGEAAKWGRREIPPHTLWVNGTIVPVKGVGVRRHPGKTKTANRMIGVVGMLDVQLSVRRPPGASDLEPVFLSGTGGWMHPTTVQKSVRRLRDRLGYPDFTTHWGRKTVATFLNTMKLTALEVADLLGHADPSMTQRVYMGRGHVSPDVKAALDRLHQQSG
jgi:integrase